MYNFMFSSSATQFSCLRVCIFGLCITLLLYCGDEAEIRSYEIPSEYTGAVVAWELPEDWGETGSLHQWLIFSCKNRSWPTGRIESCPLESVSSVDVANMFEWNWVIQHLTKLSWRNF